MWFNVQHEQKIFKDIYSAWSGNLLNTIIHPNFDHFTSQGPKMENEQSKLSKNCNIVIT